MNSRFHAYTAFRGMGALIMVRETVESGEKVLHGPFTDLRDAFEQCGEPANWKADADCASVDV